MGREAGCRRLAARLLATGHPRAARAVARACRRIGRVRLLGGMYGQFTFRTKSGVRTIAYERGTIPVSYTHLDVYKRQARGGIEVGAGQNGGIARQSGLPASLAAEVGRIGHDVFTFGYVDAMRTTMVLPVVLLAVGAASCLAIRGRKRSPEAGPAAPAASPESERASA